MHSRIRRCVKRPIGETSVAMNPKILVVDDEPDVVELVAFNLRARGFDVISATNGLDGLMLARRHQPRLVILDVMMEGMDGLSACEILRAQPATRQIPVIILTAATGEIARLNSYASGAADFLSKPFSPQDLLRRVARLLENETSPT